MRTRFLQKMTSYEVEAYLDRNDIIFVPLGVVENHGDFPMDVETVTPTAFAKVMADQVDGLILGESNYLFCGANCVSRGTVKMTIETGYRYVKEICYSLINQGFRRIIMISFHGPAYLTGGAVARDIFDETKVPVAYVDLMNVLKEAGANGYKMPEGSSINDFFYGGYAILNKKDELLIDPNGEQEGPGNSGLEQSEEMAFFSSAQKLASQSMGFYFAKPQDHGGRIGSCISTEERDNRCARGEKMIRDVIANVDMPRFVKEQRELDIWTNTVIKERYGNHLPKNKFSEWK